MALTDPFEFFVQLHLTARCNLRCRHCYQQRPGGAEFDAAEVRELIAEVQETLAAWGDAYGVSLPTE